MDQKDLVQNSTGKEGLGLGARSGYSLRSRTRHK